MRVKRFALTVGVAIFLAGTVFGQTGGRGLMLFGGLGFAGIEYQSDVQEYVDIIEDNSGVDRFKMHLNLGIGIAVSQRTYLTGSMNGYSDIFTYSDSQVDEELQIAFVNLGLGLRFYPNVTGVVTGFDIGPAGAVSTFDASYLDEEITSESDEGLGFGIMLGYDFASRPTGFSALVGARADFMEVDGEMNTFGSIFLDLVFK